MGNTSTHFLLFIFLLLLLPCSDVAANAVVPITPSFQVTDVHEDGAAENCSSICLCVCCGQRTVVAKNAKFHVEFPLLAVRNTIKSPHFVVQHLEYNIWQPPKAA